MRMGMRCEDLTNLFYRLGFFSIHSPYFSPRKAGNGSRDISSADDAIAKIQFPMMNRKNDEAPFFCNLFDMILGLS